MRPTIAFIIADGFEDIEFFATYDILKRANFNCYLYSVDNIHVVKSKCGIMINVNNPLFNLDVNEIGGIVIPGGPGIKKIQKYTNIHNILNIAISENKLIAAICSAPIILEEGNLLSKYSYTCNPEVVDSIKTGKYINENVVIDKNLITAQAPGNVFAFAFEIINYFYKDEGFISKLKRNLNI